MNFGEGCREKIPVQIQADVRPRLVIADTFLAGVVVPGAVRLGLCRPRLIGGSAVQILADAVDGSYEDFLRQRSQPLWPEGDPRRRALVARRCRTADEVAEWVRELRNGSDGLEGRNGRRDRMDGGGALLEGGGPGSMPSMGSMSYAEIAANAAHVLVGVACALLDRQIERLAADFEREGGFTERLYRVRSRSRADGQNGPDRRNGRPG